VCRCALCRSGRRDDLGRPWQQLRRQVFLGSEPFVDQRCRQLLQDRDLSEVPRVRRRPPAKPLQGHVRLQTNQYTAIAAGDASGGYTLKQIGEYFALYFSQVSRIARRVRDARRAT